ncbi:MAG: TIGR04211 family SH3 domain-containing protein [Gammaproteobacteria bacterium]|nr:TIGR04211 family SH3 domain-containing protein [Gammaproteobacteria bacterium]
MKSLLILLLFFLTASVIAETRYVSDKLTIFIRTGPTHQFRIVGTLIAGDAVEIIADDIDKKATKVRLESGREVWVDTEQLIVDKPNNVLLKEKTIALQKLTNSSKKKISDLQQELIQAREMAAHSSDLQQQVTQLENEKEFLEQKNQTLSDRSRYDLVTAGGIVAFVGLILGLLLPKFIRRKRNDVWR